MPSAKPAKASAKKRLAKTSAPRAGEAERILQIFERFAAALPEPKGELEYRNHFTLLVAVVLSAQATDAGVNKATRGLFAVADTPQKMLELGEQGLIENIKTIGLYRNKAKNVIALSEALLRDHDGEVPANRDALEALPGVGRKTANVVLNIAFGEETIAVDTHVFRVANRIPLAPGRTPAEVEAGLLRIVPKPFLRHAHHWLILHGRYTCKALAPACWRCVIQDLCRWEGKRLEPDAKVKRSTKAPPVPSPALRAGEGSPSATLSSFIGPPHRRYPRREGPPSPAKREGTGGGRGA